MQAIEQISASNKALYLILNKYRIGNDRTTIQSIIQNHKLLKKQSHKRCSAKYLTELERVLLPDELEISGDENKHPAGGARRLTIDGTDLVLALLKRQAGELGHDILGTHGFLALESEHRAVLVQVREPGPIGIERRIVVLHECLRHCVWIHFNLSLSFGVAFCSRFLSFSIIRKSKLTRLLT